jgi:hypothetical protein
MRGRRRAIVTLAGLVMGTASGCGDEPPLPPVVWEGEHLRFGTDADETTLCAGTMPYLDGAVGYLGEVFDRPDARVDYYWLPDGTEPYCSEDADGCVNERGTFSRYTIHQHELVHAIRWPHNLYLPLEEGLAEAFGDDWKKFLVQGDIRDLLEDPRGNGYIPGPGYGLAGHFVSYLHADHGLETLMELDAATNYAQSYASAAAAFERVYDQPLDDAIDQYEAEYLQCGTLTYRDKGYDCSRNVVEAPTAIDGRLDLEISLACDDPAVLGPRLGQRWTTVTLDVKVAGRYLINGRPLEDQPFEIIEIRNCDTSCFEGADALSSLTGIHLGGGYCLEPARYLFRFAVEEDVDNTYELNVRRVDPQPCE